MLSLVIKSSIQTVLQLFNSVEWDWNAIRDRGWFFLTTWLFSQKQGHILGCPSIVLHYTIAVVHKRVIKKKQLMQSSFLVVDRKHDRFVFLCVSPFHGRAISEGHRNQAVCTSLFCWHGSLKSLWPPGTGRIEGNRPTLCPSRCLRGVLCRAKPNFITQTLGCLIMHRVFLPRKKPPSFDIYIFKCVRCAQNGEKPKQSTQHLPSRLWVKTNHK